MLGRSREVALGLKQAGEVVEAKRGIGMVGAERFRDVFRNETPDRAGRVYRGDNLAVGSEDEAGRLQVAGLGVHVGASCGGDRIGVRAEADGIMDPMLIDLPFLLADEEMRRLPWLDGEQGMAGEAR